MSFPVGFRFHPSDRELVFHYLYRKVVGKPLPCEHVVTECDLYGEREPWQIYGGSTEKIRYFFTKLKKKTDGGSRIDRTIGSGTWKGQRVASSVLDEQGRCIGRKKMLTYENKGSAMNHGRWVMHEYGLDGSLLDETQVSELFSIEPNSTSLLLNFDRTY
ncbi:hypothetical protein L1049_011385 [Liquidambar formosana]|uniref:NAC domain-containing protein n=1 Tax=Liquidambar formosana TaxID=63359 RepID=A0AAP0RRQ7_LIQFO